MDRVSTRLIASFLIVCIAGDALASGFRPFAFSDSFTVFRGQTATVLDSGARSVLDNDWDWERDELTAVLEQGPNHGSLELRPDGTFVYTHDGSSPDSDSFRYSAFDGTRNSRSARVSIRIEEPPNQPPRVIGNPGDQQAVEGSRFELELAEYFVDPDPDDELTYSARGLPGSGSLSIDRISGELSGTVQKGDARSTPYDVEITARDRAGDSARLRFELLIKEDDRADVALDIRVLTNPIAVGETSRWEVVIDNKGPGELEIGTLTAEWATAGPSLSLTAPAGCSLSDNNTSEPWVTCDITALPAGNAAVISIEGVQDGAGDNSLIGIVVADDPKPGNNADLASAQVVAAFSEGPTQTIDFSGGDVDAGDLNGDDEIDVVASGAETIIYLNNGNRALATPGTSLGASSGGSSVALLDWNGDSHLDIAVGGLADRTAEIFTNDGLGNFASAARVQNNIGTVRDIAGGDFDADGRADVVVAGSSGVVIASNDGQDGASLTSLSAAGALSLSVADIDRDGDRDIAAIRTGNRRVGIYLNDGSGAAFSKSELQFGSVGTINVTDINQDGAPDLLLGLDGDDLQAPQHQVAYQQGNGEFSAAQTFGASPVSGLLTGDINDDGWTDIAAVNEGGVHQVYLGSSQGGLSLASEQLVSDGMRRGVLIDFNGDKSLDLVLIGPDNAGIEIHANNGIGRLGRGDRIAPNLTLLGERTITLTAGAAYVEAGATATDDIDGDLTNLIEISGTVNTTAIGTQTLTYRVSDRAGNTATAVRTIEIGVNEGTGGEGGGAVSPALLLLLALVAIRRRLCSSINL